MNGQVTKQSLIAARESVNDGLLKLRQVYDASDATVYLIVEGKDDLAYYEYVMVRYQPLDFQIICAGNRAKVIEVYEKTSHNDAYSQDRIFFFIDRDVSDFTGQFTPNTQNVYVTDAYSIENSLFTEHLFFAALQGLFKLDDMSSDDREKLSGMYREAVRVHEEIFCPVMCWVIVWRKKNINAHLDNINGLELYSVDNGKITPSGKYSTSSQLEQAIHNVCKVEYHDYDLATIASELDSKGGIHKYIRGKYVRKFFIKFINSITGCMSTILKGKTTLKANISLGESNAVEVLGGLMTTPESLDRFIHNSILASVSKYPLAGK